jgi:tetratricopeptide (TPR) repeat protein
MPAAYREDQDIVRLNADVMNMNQAMETFTMQFANVKPSSCDLVMMWENTAVSFPITTDVETKVMGQIDQLMNKDNRPYYNAALYYMETGKDLNQALAWFDKAAELQPNAYWVHHQRANCLAKLGKKEDAKAAAEKSKALAIEQKNDDYVRLNDKLLAELAK